MRLQSAGQQPPCSISVEFLGVSSSVTPHSSGPEDLELDASLLSTMEKATGHFIVWVPQPNLDSAATTTVELFARRRDLPILPERISGSIRGSTHDTQAPTSVADLQTGLLTSVYDEPPCFVLRNRFSLSRVETTVRPSTPGIKPLSEPGKGTDVDRDLTTNRPTGRRVFELRPVILAVIAIGVGCFLWGSGSSMTAATSPAAQRDQTEDTGSSSNDGASASDSSESGNTPTSVDTSNTADSQDMSLDGVPPAASPRQADEETLTSAAAGAFDRSPSAAEARLLRDATYLASDDLEGRGVRTEGLEKAAEYLAKQFSAAGLNTSHFNGTPFQEFELLSLGGNSPVQQIEFRDSNGLARRLLPNEDFASLVLSRSAKLDVPLVFAGFGISAPEVGYNDYQGLDVAGKAVVVLRHAPPAFDTETDDLVKHSYIRTKIAGASARGASAVILCSDLTSFAARHPGSADTNKPSDKLLNVELTLDEGIRPIPVIHFRRDVLKEVLSGFSNFDLDAVERQISTSGTSASQELEGLTMAGHVSQLRRGRTLKNVVVTLDPPEATTDETIVVGAHYDHLGHGGWGSLTLGANNEIHNGADDNASGTAVLLEVARQLAAAETPLSRRILFVAFSAEELGLIGSRKYVKEPLVPIDKSIAMLNLDMVGRLRNDRLTVYGTGSSKTWSPLLDAFAPRQGLTIVGKPSGYGPSDHASFYEAGVPVLHFFTGFHPQYHRPEDDVEHLNVEGMRRIAGLVADLVTTLAQAEERPSRSLASKGSSLSGMTLGLTDLIEPGASTGPPTLGIVPATPQQGRTGVLVRKTVSRSAADLHGIRTGDVIVRVGESRIDSVEQLVTKVRAQSRDEKLPVELVRNGIHMEVRIQF